MFEVLPIEREIRKEYPKAAGKKSVIRRWMTVDEAYILAGVAKEYDYFFECGTANGWSALWAAAVGCKVYTFDPVDRWKVYENYPEAEERIVYIDSTWAEGLPQYINDEIKGRSCCFIDGEHDYQNALSDWQAAEPWFDTIVFHDTKMGGVLRVVFSIPDTYYKIVIPTSRGIGIVSKRRLPWVIPSLE